MNKLNHLLILGIFSVVLLGITGCEDRSNDPFEIPPWLGGSSIETLQERGNYTIFLELMEKANYTEPISKQLFTLFVPDDNAFREYFKSAGINSVADLTEDEAVQLFTLHVLRNPRSRGNLIYEFAWGEYQGPDQGGMGEYASLFHRKPTPSTSIPYKETIRYLPGRVGEELLIYTGDKNVPLFSEEFFHDYGGLQDGSDYLFLYPDSKWKEGYTSNLKALNWHNAMVIPNPEIPDELEVRTASGFIYFIDRVVPPMPSIEEYMRDNPDRFGVYYDILQRFATYGNSKVDEQDRVLWRKGYDMVFNLAEERGTSLDQAVPPQNMWSAFIPNNTTLQNYLDNTVLKNYSSLDSVPRVTLYYILQTQLSRTLVIKSKMENSYFNAFGDKTPINLSDIVSRYMTSNGPVYETNRVLEPNVFTCVPGILFVDKDYTTLLYVLSEANVLSTLSNPDADVTLFATTNKQLEEYGIRYNETDAIVEFRSPVNGQWNTMRNSDLVNFAQDQVVNGPLSDFTGDGYARLASGNYVHYAANKLESSENQMKGEPGTLVSVEENERNGFLVKLDKPIQSRWVIGQYLVNDPDLSEFTGLLTSTRLLDTRYRDPITREVIQNLKFFAAADNWTAFIPTNEAMEKARAEGIIPEGTGVSWYNGLSNEGKDSIDNFIMNHFLVNTVVFDDGNLSGAFDTNYSYLDEDGKTKINSKLNIINEPQNLTIADITGQEVTVEHENADILVQKGVVHKINTALKYRE